MRRKLSPRTDFLLPRRSGTLGRSGAILRLVTHAHTHTHTRTNSVVLHRLGRISTEQQTISRRVKQASQTTSTPSPDHDEGDSEDQCAETHGRIKAGFCLQGPFYYDGLFITGPMTWRPQPNGGILGSTTWRLRCRGARGQVPAQSVQVADPPRRATLEALCLWRQATRRRRRQPTPHTRCQRRGANRLSRYSADFLTGEGRSPGGGGAATHRSNHCNDCVRPFFTKGHSALARLGADKSSSACIRPVDRKWSLHPRSLDSPLAGSVSSYYSRPSGRCSGWHDEPTGANVCRGANLRFHSH
jgi:hypothetical protein